MITDKLFEKSQMLDVAVIADILGISRALRGKRPNIGFDMEGYIRLLPKECGFVRREDY